MDATEWAALARAACELGGTELRVMIYEAANPSATTGGTAEALGLTDRGVRKARVGIRAWQARAGEEQPFRPRNVRSAPGTAVPPPADIGTRARVPGRAVLDFNSSHEFKTTTTKGVQGEGGGGGGIAPRSDRKRAGQAGQAGFVDELQHAEYTPSELRTIQGNPAKRANRTQQRASGSALHNIYSPDVRVGERSAGVLGAGEGGLNGEEFADLLGQVNSRDVRIRMIRAAALARGLRNVRGVLEVGRALAEQAVARAKRAGKSADLGALFSAIVERGGAVDEWDRREEARRKREAAKVAAASAPAAPAPAAKDDTEMRADEQRRARALDAINAASFEALSAAWLAALNSGKVAAGVVARARKWCVGSLDDLRKSAGHRLVCEAVAEMLQGGGS